MGCTIVVMTCCWAVCCLFTGSDPPCARRAHMERQALRRWHRRQGTLRADAPHIGRLVRRLPGGFAYTESLESLGSLPAHASPEQSPADIHSLTTTSVASTVNNGGGNSSRR